MLQRIESDILPLEDIPVRLARYGRTDPTEFVNEMRVRMSAEGKQVKTLTLSGPVPAKGWLTTRKEPEMATIQAIFVGHITVTDPDTGAPVELEVMKDPESGAMFAIDGSYIAQVSGCFNSPFNNSQLRAPE